MAKRTQLHTILVVLSLCVGLVMFIKFQPEYYRPDTNKTDQLVRKTLSRNTQQSSSSGKLPVVKRTFRILRRK